MKKPVSIVLSCILSLSIFAGCGTAASSSPSATPAAPAATEAQAAAPAAGETLSGPVTVVSREDGSGTRGAFVELLKIEKKDESGKKIDHTTDTAEITNSTSVMLGTIAGNKNAIGYVSLGTLNDTVKALQIDGVTPSAETIKKGEYKVSRPFYLAMSKNISDNAKDFIKFILSSDGQAVVAKKGYIPMDTTEAYKPISGKGKITVAGSSSVTPLMEALKEEYVKRNPDMLIEVQQSDSTTGMSSAIEGICDIGMASREPKDSEKAAGLENVVIAMDGIAVIVNKENPIVTITAEQIAGIYMGEITNWKDVK